MIRKLQRNVIYLIVITFFSCKTVIPTQQVQNSTQDPPNIVTAATNSEVPNKETNTIVFDPTLITPEKKQETMIDIRAFISRLNIIIREQDYETWLSYLTYEYITFWSDPQKLAQESERAFLKSRNITIKSLKDYFLYVVCPAKNNARVDDIDFIGENKIVAYAILKGERGVLYYLEKQENEWKIGIGR